jgi:hypothetical protein
MKKEISLQLLNLEIVNMKKAVAVIGEIIKIIPKFEGKKPTKHLDTALKTIDKNLNFHTEYNSFVIKLHKENRMINTGDNVFYTLENYVNIFFGSIQSSSGNGICQNGVIDSKLLITALSKQIEYYNKLIIQLTNEISKHESIIQKYNEIKQAMESFNNSISFYTREYFSLKLK